MNDPVIITAGSSRAARDLADAWQRRALLGLIARRHLQVRYKQAVLGAAWVALQPLATMLLFIAVFTGIARLPTDGMPAAVFYLAALVPWSFFSSSFSTATNGLIENPSLVTRVHLPRMFLPLGAILAGLADLAVGATILLVVLLFHGRVPGPEVVAVVPAIGLLVLTLAGATLWTSALNARFRDMRMILPLVTQALLFSSPIIYSASQVPEGWRAVYFANPIAVSITTFRWAVAGGPGVPMGPALVATAISILLLLGGWSYFAKTSRTIADRV